MSFRKRTSDQIRLHFDRPDSCGADDEVEVSCKACRQALSVPAWYLESGTGLHFCNADCRRAWTEQSPTFEVELGRQSSHRGGNWLVQSKRARQRDGYTCQECGTTEEELGRQLDVHHKIPFHRFKSNVEANKLEHLITLCPACHARTEAQLHKELPLFQQTKK
ncbi:MAG: hypothetical protein GKR89_28320 [Candidatus Latescibacteria bacterium]|nr:hypothetical protein [Candidatus Latescibacterota bacterium]